MTQPAEENDYFEKPEHTGDMGVRQKYDERPWTVALTAVDTVQETRT